MAAVGGCWAGGPPVPCCAAVGWPAVCRRASSADVAVPLAASLIAAVAGCSFDGAAVELPADAPGVGPEPASLAVMTLTRLSISVVQGPAMAELTPSANSATLARMNAFVLMHSVLLESTAGEVPRVLWQLPDWVSVPVANTCRHRPGSVRKASPKRRLVMPRRQSAPCSRACLCRSCPSRLPSGHLRPSDPPR